MKNCPCPICLECCCDDPDCVNRSGGICLCSTEDDKKWWGRARITERATLQSQWGRLNLDPRFNYNKLIIDSFHGKYRWLSNFHACNIVYNGKEYRSTEHAYQATKTLDPNWEEVIRLAETPVKCKRKGQESPLRPDWGEIKGQVMCDILKIKFEDTALQDMLLNTGDAYLVEGNSWHDNYWGICLLKSCPRCDDKKGRNKLGVFLMELREELLIAALERERDIAFEIELCSKKPFYDV